MWSTMSSYRLDRLLMVISTCKFCRGCAMQFGGKNATNGRESGLCIVITHRATHRLLCSNSSREMHSCHHPTKLFSGSRSEWLLSVPFSENGPQGDAFRNHGWHQIECDGRTPQDSKISLPPVLSTMAGSMEQVCVCAQGSYFEGD